MKLSRRHMIAALGAATLPAHVSALSVKRRVLVDPSLPDVPRYIPHGATIIVRTGDPVRQLQTLLTHSPQPITGLTSGADALVARGSAREFRRKFTLVEQRGTLFRWTIAGQSEEFLRG
jgi:hypothetical protein